MARARILIIDDEENIRDAMQLALEPDGYAVATAADGRSGLERFGDGEDWDLVLLDQRMPGMEGVEVLQHLRRRDPAARVVMVTAYGSIELAVEAMKRGATDFLRKPFEPEVLRQTVQVALAQPRREPAAAAPAHPAGAGPRVSLFINGYHFWPVAAAGGGLLGTVRRAFTVQPPKGAAATCTVEFAPDAGRQAAQALDRPLAPDDELWTSLAEAVLSDYLLAEARMPPDTLVLPALAEGHQRLLAQLAAPPAEMAWEGF